MNNITTTIDSDIHNLHNLTTSPHDQENTYKNFLFTSKVRTVLGERHSNQNPAETRPIEPQGPHRCPGEPTKRKGDQNTSKRSGDISEAQR